MLATRLPGCTLRVGDTYYVQDGMRPMGWPGRFANIVRRNPWQIVAFHADVQECTGQPRRYAEQATIKSLRDGREKRVALWLLKMCEQMDIEAV